MDHGIEETAQERIDAGKDPQGEIVLSASHTSSEVVISVKDDGYGIDPQKILETVSYTHLDVYKRQKICCGLIHTIYSF